MFQFYATLDCDSDGPPLALAPRGTAALLPASSWARKRLRAPRLPAWLTERAADCGGFVAARVWGCYRYSLGDYVGWLDLWGPTWAAMRDYCCEDPLTGGDPRVVRRRQLQTTCYAWHIWDRYRDRPWAWVPTVQGWDVADVVRHARELRPLIAWMQAHYGPASAFRVGIGTLCARASAAMIHQVVRRVAEELPSVPLHLWGVKLDTFRVRDPQLACRAELPNVCSADSAAWNGLFRTAREEWKASGMRQREWAYTVALPRYQARIEQALGVAAQRTLWAA